MIGTALLLLLAGVLAAAAGWVAARQPAVDAGAVPALDGLAAVLLVAAVWAPAYDVVEPGWIGVASAGLAAVVLLAGRWLPADRRTAPAVVVLLAGLLPALAALEPVGRALDGMLQPLEQPWSSAPGSVPRSATRPVESRPAALTRMSMRFSVAANSPKTRVTSAGSPTSATADRAGLPRVAIAEAAWRPASAFLSTMHIVQPSAESALAIASPIPAAPPVTTATRPFRLRSIMIAPQLSFVTYCRQPCLAYALRSSQKLTAR